VDSEKTTARKRLPYYLRTYFKSYTFYAAIAFFMFFYFISIDVPWSHTHKPTFFILLIVIVCGPMVPWIWTVSTSDELKMMRRSTFEQYRLDHPESVSSNNRISCFSCNGDQIFVRKVRDRIYWQEHVCKQCGKSLYYSSVR